MKILPIVQLGDPVLRRRARQIAPRELREPVTQELIEAMRETMRDAPGVGLAAPQVGLSLQLAVIEDAPANLESLDPEERKAREREAVPFHVIVNPVLHVEDAGPAYFFEGCLSFTGFVASVPRARAVRVECLDERGESRVIRAHGWYARILQHEIDHLNGIVYVDRMETRTLMSSEAYGSAWGDRSTEQIRAALESVRRAE
ncbi:MAG: peptide deformylase [Candidatus Eiseniibacteriota bacterium]